MKRTRLAKGVYRLPSGHYAVIWKDRGRNREKHFAADTPMAALRDYRKRMVKTAVEKHATPEDQRGSFVRDCVRFLRTRQGRPSYKSDRSHLKPWMRRFGRFSRHAITTDKINLALAEWASSFSVGERRHRVNILRALFHCCDGPQTPTPCDYAAVPSPVKARPRGVSDDIIRRVAANLAEQERTGRLRDGKTRARFLVLATCGKRPCQVKRARPQLDVNFDTRIWDVEPAKNSLGGPLWLNDEMLAAWRAFDAAQAWGPYDSRSFAKTLQRNGWPKGVRPYNMRHQTLQTMSHRGVDFGLIQQAAGHASPETTRTHYVPHEVEHSRLASGAIDGRFAAVVFETTPRAIPTSFTNRTAAPKRARRGIIGKTADRASAPKQGRGAA